MVRRARCTLPGGRTACQSSSSSGACVRSFGSSWWFRRRSLVHVNLGGHRREEEKKPGRRTYVGRATLRQDHSQILTPTKYANTHRHRHRHTHTHTPRVHKDAQRAKYASSSRIGSRLLLCSDFASKTKEEVRRSSVPRSGHGILFVVNDVLIWSGRGAGWAVEGFESKQNEWHGGRGLVGGSEVR
ncbi:hypothetical protein LY78DRAFT_270230 [Colletotrichum sublineola]|nr:hypothetical protein LY78DRAFT_270230 [Colletotrichum sublineola]